MPAKIKPEDYADHFWSRSKTMPNKCWEWMGALNACGYGTVRKDGKTWLAHRVAYELEFGPFPKHMHVLHGDCNNPKCVNPWHLRLGTHQENMDQMREQKRYKAQRMLGETHGLTTLVDAQVMEIRALRGSMPQHKIAAMYGVCQMTISNIQLRKTWAHLK